MNYELTKNEPKWIMSELWMNYELTNGELVMN